MQLGASALPGNRVGGHELAIGISSDVAVPWPEKVVSLEWPAFAEQCGRLMQMVLQDGRPDALIAIRNGGVHVAEAMVAALESPLHIIPITCRRPSSRWKARVARLMPLLSLVPRSVLDRLRLIEHRHLTRNRTWSAEVPYQFDSAELETLDAWLRAREQPPYLLVVDDAIDTGGTLAHVMSALAMRTQPNTIVRAAVITVTTTDPLANADFTLHRSELYRFPWSYDT